MRPCLAQTDHQLEKNKILMFKFFKKHFYLILKRTTLKVKIYFVFIKLSFQIIVILIQCKTNLIQKIICRL